MPASVTENHPDGLCHTLVNHVARLGYKDIWEMLPLGSATANPAEERAPSPERHRVVGGSWVAFLHTPSLSVLVSQILVDDFAMCVYLFIIACDARVQPRTLSH